MDGADVFATGDRMPEDTDEDLRLVSGPVAAPAWFVAHTSPVIIAAASSSIAGMALELTRPAGPALEPVACYRLLGVGLGLTPFR